MVTRGTCNICGKILDHWYADAKLRSGQWADLCLSCFESQGIGIGTDTGRLFQVNQTTQKWEKIAG